MEIERTKEQQLVEALKVKELRNIAERVASKKPLTASERKLLAEFEDSKEKKEGSAASLIEVAERLEVPKTWVKEALANGVPRTPGGRIKLETVSEWIEANRDKLLQLADKLPLKEQKTAEEVRKLKIANDLKAGRLVERAWVNERFQKLGGEINAIRSKSEAEDAMRFAEAAGDPAKCRTVLRSIWDRILIQFVSTGKHFEE